MCNSGIIVVAGYNKTADVMFIKDRQQIFKRRYNESQMREVMLDCNKVLAEHDFKYAYIILRKSTFSAAEAISQILKSNIKIKYIKDMVRIPHNGCRRERRFNLMGKKINCKHGLDKKQEIQARRLRVKLELGDNEVIVEYKKLWDEWFVEPKTGFVEFLQKRDVVYYSAYLRASQTQGMATIYTKISNL